MLGISSTKTTRKSFCTRKVILKMKLTPPVMYWCKLSTDPEIFKWVVKGKEGERARRKNWGKHVDSRYKRV